MNEISPSTETNSPAVFETQDYRLLKGHARTDGSFKSDEQLRSEYIHRTDELIRIMTEGVDVTDPTTGEMNTKKPDYVVWLDKSARPVAWLTKELWPKLAPAPGEEPPKMPKFRFVNIDREQWVNTVDPNGSGYMNIDLVDQSVIRSLRSIFVSPTRKVDSETGKGKLDKRIDTAPAELDNKTVLIVDEVMSSGRTLDIAQKFFRRAFPTAQIATAHWMGGVAQIGQAIGNADLPIWYQEKSNKGRGVDNRDERLSQASESVTQQLGAWFLSTRFPELDPDSALLRKELHDLANDPNVLVVPSLQRDDFVERAEALNHMTFDEFKVAKTQLGSKS